MTEYRNLAYTSPLTKTRLEFEFDGSLEDGLTHNLGEFQFAGVDGKYYQDRSLTTDEFVFNVFIKDQEILRSLRSVLSEKVSINNTGTLEHPDPTIGNIPVVISSFRVSQNTIRGIGIIRVAITFYKQIPSIIAGDPAETENPASAANVLDTIDTINDSQANDAAASAQIDTGRGFAKFVESSTKTVTDIKDILGKIAAKTDAINILFTNSYAELISGIDTFAREPFTLARKIQNLIQLPMLAVTSASDRFAAYKEYVDETLNLSEEEENAILTGSPDGANILTAKSVAALAAISAINYSAVSTASVTLDQIKSGEAQREDGYLYRSQIINAIKTVQDTARETTEILSDYTANFGAESFFSQFFDYSILNKYLVTIAVRNLNNRIFSSIQEKKIVTEIEYHPVVLCGILYNSVEINTLNFFLNSNNLHGNNIYLIPKGTEVVYYE